MKFLNIILMGILLCCCTPPKKHSYGFYYWKSKLSLNTLEKEVLKKSSLPVLYTRFFDIDKKNGNFQPLGIIQKEKNFESDKKITPVIFITNRTFIGITKEEIDFLAEKIYQLIHLKSKTLNLNTTNEIQIDCDWTESTQTNFFFFLKLLKEKSKKTISSTLRLHQVKDHKIMGIPPVSKVYLMCYATSSPLIHSDKNSILEVELLKNYLANLEDYPIRNISIALPIYSWGIVTNHVGKNRLINALNIQDLEHPKIKKISKNEAVILEDGFYFGNFLNKGFHLKIEEITEKQLSETILFLESKLNSFDIIYYHLHHSFLLNRNFL